VSNGVLSIYQKEKLEKSQQKKINAVSTASQDGVYYRY
jgi:hypothetical protein